LFVVLNVLSWGICHLIFLFCATVFKKRLHPDADEYEEELFGEYESQQKEAHARFSKRNLPRIAVYAVLQVILTVFVIMTPIVAYMDCVPGVVSVISDVGLLSKDQEDANAVTAEKINSVVDTVNKTPLVVCYRVLGGNAMCNGLTSFEVDGQKSTLAVELTAIAEFSTDIYVLYGLEITDYSEEEIVLLREIDEDMHISIFLPVVAGEIIYNITDAWLADEPRTFLGMSKPTFDKDTTSMATEPFMHILEAFHKDAHDVEALRNDFETMERVVEILVHNEVFESMKEEHTNLLVSILTSGNTVGELVDEFGRNPSFVPLQKDITNIGMRAVGSSLKIPANADQSYGQFTDDVANVINDINAAGMTEEEKKASLTNSIRETYKKEAGKELGVSDDVVGLYADVLLEEFGDKENVTPDEVKAFFDAYTGIETEDAPAGLPEGTPEGTPEGGNSEDAA
ncbi:MAG: hypothetical protein IKC59_07555, partial [Clostridia bacterium]|nr:hypothetical protein [Clostridia bacterium]